MSKKKKSIAKDHRRAQKKARKMAEKAKYAAWKEQGQNTKSKRVKLRAKRAQKMRMSKHSQGPCGNVGCSKCNPVPENLYTPRQISYLMH